MSNQAVLASALILYLLTSILVGRLFNFMEASSALMFVQATQSDRTTAPNNVRSHPQNTVRIANAINSERVPFRE